MKRILSGLFILAFCILFSSCNKDGTSAEKGNGASLNGEWELNKVDLYINGSVYCSESLSDPFVFSNGSVSVVITGGQTMAVPYVYDSAKGTLTMGQTYLVDELTNTSMTLSRNAEPRKSPSTKEDPYIKINGIQIYYDTYNEWYYDSNGNKVYVMSSYLGSQHLCEKERLFFKKK